MKPSERLRGHSTHKQNAQAGGDDVVGGAEIEISHPGNEKPRYDEVRKSPEHVHRRG